MLMLVNAQSCFTTLSLVPSQCSEFLLKYLIPVHFFFNEPIGMMEIEAFSAEEVSIRLFEDLPELMVKDVVGDLQTQTLIVILNEL